MTDLVGYLPGDSWLISGAAAMVMTDGDAADARRYWDLVRRNASAADLLAGTGPGPAAGALAVLVWEPAGVRVLVRGTAGVRVRRGAGGRSEVTAANLLTWREELLVDVVEVEVVLAAGELPVDAPAETDLLPVPAGVVRAALARRRTDDRSPSATGAGPAASVGPGPESAAQPQPQPQPEPESAAQLEPELQPEPEPGFEPAAAEEPRSDVTDVAEPVAAERIDENVVVGDDAVTVISMVPASSRDLPAAGRTGVPDPFDDDAESGRDPAPDPAGPTPDAPVATADAPGPAAQADPAPDAKPGLPERDRADEAARHRAPDVTQSVPLDYEEDPILDRVPSAVPGRAQTPDRTLQTDLLPGPPEPGSPVPVLGDHDGITELAEDLPAGFTPPPLPPPLAAGWVYASLCPSGHANQPHAGNCRVCGQPIPPGDPVVAPQPLLGRLRFSTGELVDLDRRVIIGRAPSVSRVSSSELPRLVTVPSPQQDISRSHAEVRIEDWHVVVADLHSTNGTVLRAPDRPEQLLHPGQEMVIEPGWTVDLGDGVTVAVEAAG